MRAMRATAKVASFWARCTTPEEAFRKMAATPSRCLSGPARVDGHVGAADLGSVIAPGWEPRKIMLGLSNFLTKRVVLTLLPAVSRHPGCTASSTTRQLRGRGCDKVAKSAQDSLNQARLMHKRARRRRLRRSQRFVPRPTDNGLASRSSLNFTPRSSLVLPIRRGWG